MNPKKYLPAALSIALTLAACQTEQTPTDNGGFAPGQERPLVLTPVVSSTDASSPAADATRADAASTATPVTLLGGNLALTLSKNATPGAPTQLAVYGLAVPAAGSAASPLAYDHAATRDTLTAHGKKPDDARALYVTDAGSYPLAAVGTRLKAGTKHTEKMKLHPNVGMGTDPVATFANLPFALHASRTATDAPINVAADGTAALPLHITSAGVMLRMRCLGMAVSGGKPMVRINSVRCLPTNETAPRKDPGLADVTDEAAGTPSRVVPALRIDSDGDEQLASGPDNIYIDYVLFGTLTAGQPLAKGDALVEINATLFTVPTDDGTPTREDKTFTVRLPRTVAPTAGQLLIYTVHVNQSIASIEGDVIISGFVPGNGEGGQDIGVGGK